jgi:NAD(P)-dependent dehydrogenase (short-subunit alcohol dehydrogenase family)
MRLKGKVAIVTGAASEIGIGHSIAVLFAKEGAMVTVADIQDEGGKKTAEQINRQGGRAICCLTDVSNADQVKRMTQATVESFGAIHILVNNAAHMKDSHAVLDTTEEEWDRSMSITLKGTFLCSKFALPEMIKAGGGSIVNMSSVGGLVGFEGDAPYVSAKGGVIQLTKSLAIDYGRHNVRVNAICPGPIRTSISPQKQEKLYAYHVAMTLLGRTAEPSEVAYAALFLASDESSFVTGTNLVVDGGWTAR